MNVQALIIHLERAEKRRDHVNALLASLPMPGQIIAAVDGQSLSDTEIRAFYKRRLHSPLYPFSLTRNEIACMLSHRRAWQTIIDLNLDAALIMEDDAGPTSDFCSSLSLGLLRVQEDGFIRFPFRDGREEGPVIAWAGQTRMISPNRLGLGMVTQLVSHEAARKLLDATSRFDRPVDVLMQMPWITGVNPTSIVPGAIRELSYSLGGSTIVRRRTLASKIYHEIMRPAYRLLIAMRSRNYRRERKAPIASVNLSEPAKADS
ncbi:glycosyltransferase family 25 protein [Allorhizobium sp. BGMRC 0089]|nr:glycosyltransferase family 25 protein [Allorhizobium sonneratiae]MCM2294304.1 glycosyltransferase family 25 protein [Allorhizobium sonneratiae]